jgi:hypothetical protein
LCLKKCFFGLQDMECLGYTVSTGKISVSINKVEAVAKWPMSTTQNKARSFVQLFYVNHFSDLTASLTDLHRKSQPHKITLALACLEAFETFKLRLISGPCLILQKVILDAMHRGYKCFEIGDCTSNVVRIGRRRILLTRRTK